MIWEQKVLIIVMTTRVLERGRTKCGQYWPCELNGETSHSHFTIKNTLIRQFTDYVVTQLKIIDKNVCSALIYHIFIIFVIQ